MRISLTGLMKTVGSLVLLGAHLLCFAQSEELVLAVRGATTVESAKEKLMASMYGKMVAGDVRDLEKAERGLSAVIPGYTPVPYKGTAQIILDFKLPGFEHTGALLPRSLATREGYTIIATVWGAPAANALKCAPQLTVPGSVGGLDIDVKALIEREGGVEGAKAAAQQRLSGSAREALLAHLAKC
jgi:hypothetical protein